MLDCVDPFALGAKRWRSFAAKGSASSFRTIICCRNAPRCENVLIPKLAPGKVSDVDAQRERELLANVGLDNRATHLPAELSGGERQRVAIARALMNRPRLILCDEPTGNLDTKTGHAIGELLTRLAAESQAILIAVTHSAAAGRNVSPKNANDGRSTRLKDTQP